MWHKSVIIKEPNERKNATLSVKLMGEGLAPIHDRRKGNLYTSMMSVQNCTLSRVKARVALAHVRERRRSDGRRRKGARTRAEI